MHSQQVSYSRCTSIGCDYIDDDFLFLKRRTALQRWYEVAIALLADQVR
jgi:hypothetical protein